MDIICKIMAYDCTDGVAHYHLVTGGRYVLTGFGCPHQTDYNRFEVVNDKISSLIALFTDTLQYYFWFSESTDVGAIYNC